MSASNTPINSPVPTQDKVEKKPRAPILPAKFSKFIHFGYWFMNQLNSDPDAPAVDETLFIEKLNLFSDVESQLTFVQAFFDDAKDINKTIRGLVKQKSKDLAKATKLASKPKDKIPRKKVDKKIKQSSPEDSFVNEMVQLANGDDIPSLDSNLNVDKKTTLDKVKVDKEVKVKVDKEVKVKVDKEVKVKVDKETKLDKVNVDKEVKVKVDKVKVEKEVKVKEVKVDKEVKVKEPKAKTTKVNLDPSPDDLTQVSILNLDGVQYLIDDHNLVYHFQNHSLIGSFDPSSNAII